MFGRLFTRKHEFSLSTQLTNKVRLYILKVICIITSVSFSNETETKVFFYYDVGTCPGTSSTAPAAPTNQSPG